jgi:glycosyltransferase involved in cell wall biosynthesis
MTRIAAALDETALRRVDATMVINPSMHAHAESVARGTQAQVIYAPPGIDTDVFRPIEFGETSADQPYILAVGRFSDVRKNLLLLLKAYAVVVSRLDRAPDLLLAGADDPGAQFWVQAEVLGLRSRIRTQLRPSLETLVTLYQNALCLAVPSDEEGFCVVVTEAMASGIPVVSTRSGGPSPAGHLRPDPVVPAVLGQRSRIASASS